jgi:PAS domain S-box-containing protein
MAERRLNVLVAEDEPAHAEAIRRAFQSAPVPAELVVAGTLREYRNAVIHRTPDIALLDLNLPDGRALEALTSPAVAGEFPVLIMTSFGDEQVAVEAMKAGALDYLVKSQETFSSLPHVVARALREWDLLRAHRRNEAHIGHLNSVLRGIRNVNQLITRERAPQALIQRTCELLVDSRGFQTSCIVRCQDERVLSSALAGDAEKLRTLRRILAGGQAPECVKSALRSGEVFLHSRHHPLCEGCEGCEVRSDSSGDWDAAAVRLESEGEVFGVLLVSLPVGMVADPEEVELLHEVASDVAFALRSIELQAARDQSAADLARLRTAWRTISESVRDGILVADVETRRFVVANQTICTMLGYRREELLTLELRDIHPRERVSEVEALLARQLRGELSLITDIPVLRKDGSVFAADINSTPVQLEGRACIAGVFRDVSDRARAEVERQRLEEQLRMAQRLEAVGRLAGGVAHDFNNLLSVIINCASFASEGLGEDHPVRADIVEIQRAGERAATLTRQLLAFSRKQLLEPEVLCLNRVVSGIDSMLRRLLGEDIEVEVRLAEDLGNAVADPGQLEQVIVNLAVNARDAMPQGGKLTIETTNVDLDDEFARQHVSVKPGPFVMLSVTDSGAGMDAETQAHLFEPFFTTKEKGKGTGLGLSTVYGIVKQSGGNIWVYSEPGRGTTLKVYLPQVDAPAVDVRKRPATVLAAGSETVLLVEDDDAVRRLAERVLRGAGYHVLTAPSGTEALVLYEQQQGRAVDLLLTDVVMPQMGGRELAEHLARKSPRLKVLYMSGYADGALTHRGVLDPGTRIVGKPFSATELTRKVREVLDEPSAPASC